MDVIQATTTRNTLPTTEGVCENATILDDGYQLCPWCRSEVKPYFINFNEKLLMCENTSCDFPFGHENFTIVKEDNDAPPDVELQSLRSGRNRCSSPSATLSTSGWSDIDKLNQANDIEEDDIRRSQSKGYFTHRNNSTKIRQARESQKKLLKEVEALKKLSLELSAQEPETAKSDPKIKNEKWIKNLLSKEKLSGVSLLQPEEVQLFKKKSLDIGSGELKIDINMGNEEHMSSIRIELANTQ